MSSELSVVVAVCPSTAVELLLAMVSVEEEATSSGAGFSGIKSSTAFELSAAAVVVVLATAAVEATVSVVVTALNLWANGCKLSY